MNKLIIAYLTVFAGLALANEQCAFNNAFIYGSLALADKAEGTEVTLKGSDFLDLNSLSPVEPNPYVYVDGIRFTLSTSPKVFNSVELLSQSNEVLRTISVIGAPAEIRQEGTRKIIKVQLGNDAGVFFSKSLFFDAQECTKN